MATITAAEKKERRGALVTVRQGGEALEVEDAGLSRSLARAFALWRSLKSTEAEFSREKEAIFRRAGEIAGGGSAATIESEGVSLTITPRHEALVPEENVPALRRLLGRRFKDLVRTRTRHLATGRLLGEAGPEVLALLELNALSPQFRWGLMEPSEENRGSGAAEGGAKE